MDQHVSVAGFNRTDGIIVGDGNRTRHLCVAYRHDGKGSRVITHPGKTNVGMQSHTWLSRGQCMIETCTFTQYLYHNTLTD